jgi:hypothetical protein
VAVKTNNFDELRPANEKKKRRRKEKIKKKRAD